MEKHKIPYAWDEMCGKLTSTLWETYKNLFYLINLINLGHLSSFDIRTVSQADKNATVVCTGGGGGGGGGGGRMDYKSGTNH